MPNAALTSQSVPARKAGQRFTRFVRTSLKPVVVKLSRKLSVTYWPQRRRTISLMLVALLAGFVPGFAGAAPTGGTVVAGSAAITQVNSSNMLINQQSQNAILNWKSFSIGAGEAVRFVQPNASAVALNRVIGSDPSRIFGSLSANGKVFLVNNAGVYFAPGAKVDVGALVASSMNISDASFMSGKYQFDAGANAGSVSNEGLLKGAFVVLAAPKVNNAGSIQTPGGAAALAAGGRVTLDIAGDKLVSLSVDAAAANAAVQNSGNITAEGGKVFMSARSANAVLDTVINTSGIVRAGSIVSRNGEIVIDGGSAGVVTVGGTLAAAGTGAGASGGSVKVLGDAVRLSGSAMVDVSGDAGGGKVVIGGDFHGAGAGHNATTTQVAKGAVIKADAFSSGDGGQVAVWADDATRFAGSISAKGGANGGNGGFVETSGKNTLAYSGKVDTTAAKGKTGTLLLDPGDIVISNDPADPVGSPAVVNAGDLVASLATTNVIVDTANGISGPGDITVTAPVARADANSLTLKAANNINLNAAITNTGLGSLGLHADGTVTLNAAVALAGGDFGIRGNAGGASPAGLVIGASTVSTGGGNVIVQSLGAASTGAIDAGAGTIAITGNAGVTINGALSSTNASNSAIVVNAGAGTAAGASTGGDVTISGGSISVPAGGAIVYTGSVAGSTGLEVLVGSGIGRFRYNSAPGSVNFSAPLGSGVNAVYREQPILTVGGATQTVTYGSAPNLAPSVSGLVNGDTEAQAFSTAATVTPEGATSTSGNWIAGAHDLTAAGAVDQLGYQINYVVPKAVLTVTQKALTIGGVTANDKVYDGNTSATVNTASITYTGVVAGDFVTAGVPANFVDKNVGTAKPVTLTTGGADIGNYAVTLPSLVADITRLSSVTWTGGATGDWSVASNWAGSAIPDLANVAEVVIPAGATVKFDSLVTPLSGSVQVDSINGTGALAVESGNLSVANLLKIGGYNQTGGSVAAGNVEITPASGGTVLGNLTATSLTITGGGITQTAATAVTVSGATLLAAGANNISLGNANNNFNTVAVTNADNVTVTDTNALTYNGAATTDLVINSGPLTFGTTTVGRDLTVTATGAVSQTGVLTVTRNSDITALNQTVTLADPANNFGGDLTLKSAAAEIKDADTLTAHLTTTGDTKLTSVGGLAVDGSVATNLETHSAGLTFGNLSVTGNLDATAAGPIGQTALTALTVGGAATLAAGANDISLGNVDNDFATVQITNAGNVTVTEKNGLTYGGGNAGDVAINTTGPLVLAATTVGRDLGVTATGAVSQTGALTVTRNSDITALNQTVTLADPTNNFGGDLTLKSAAAQIKDADTLTAHLTTTGDTTLTSVGAMTADGSVTGKLETHSAALTFGNLSVTGDLDATAAGPIGQTAVTALTVGGAATLAAGANDISLGNANNDFATVQIANAGNVTVTEKNGLTYGGGNAGGVAINTTGPLVLAATIVGGDLGITATGAVSQTGAVSVTGATTLAAGANDISLGHVNNDFNTVAVTNGANVTVTDVNALAYSGSNIGDVVITSGALAFGATTVGRDLTVTATGAVSQTGVLTVTRNSDITALNQTVTLADPTNNFGGDLTLKSAAAEIKDADTLTAHLTTTGDTKLTSVDGLVVDGSVATNLETHSAGLTFGNLSVTGDLDATAAGPIGQTALTALTVGGAATLAAGANHISLGNVDNDFASVQITNAGNVTVTEKNGLTYGGGNAGDVAINSTGPLVLAATTVGRDLGVTATGAVSQTGALTVTRNSDITALNRTVTLADPANKFGGDLILKSAAAQIKDADTLTAHLTTTGDTTLTSVGAMTANGSVTGKLETHSAALTFGNLSVTGDLDATAAGPIGQALASVLTVTGTATLAAGANDISLGNVDNDFATVQIATAGNVTLKEKNGLTYGGGNAGDVAINTTGPLVLAATTVGRDLGITASGAVSQTGMLTVTRNSNITALGQTVTLANPANNFGGDLTLAAGSATIKDANALTTHLNMSGSTDLTAVTGLLVDGTVGCCLDTHSGAVTFGATTVTGTLTTTATGAVTQTGVLTVTGASDIRATGQPVTLDTVGNDFGGALKLAAATATISDKNSLTANLNTSGNANLTAVTGLMVDGTVGGNLDTHSVTLAFGATSVAGNLAAAATGAVSQTGALSVTGASGITATSQTVSLDNVGNDFGGLVTLKGGTTKIADKNALNGVFTIGGDLTTSSAGLKFGATSVSGALTATATGPVIQDGIIKVDGVSGIDAGTQAVTLTMAGNDFVGALTLKGGTVDVADTNALVAHLATGAATLKAGTTLGIDGAVGGNLATNSAALAFGPATVAGNLAATATGAVSQTGALSVTGASAIEAVGQTVTLDNAGNDFVGPVTLAAGTTKINDKNALNVGASNITGALTVNAAGPVTQAGIIKVDGVTSIDAGTQAVTLNTAGNDFVGALTLKGGTVDVADTNALVAHLTTGAATLKAGTTLGVDGSSGTLRTNSGALTLGATAVTGNLVSTATGAVSQTGALTVSGSSAITATGQSVLLTQAGNDFGGTLSLAAGSAQVTDKNALNGLFNIAGNLDINSGALTFGKSDIVGNLVVHAAGDVNQGVLPSPALSSLDGSTILLASLTGSAGAPITVKGTTNIDAGTGKVVLADLGNDFGGAVSANGSSITLRDANTLTVDKLTAPTVDLGANNQLQMVAGGLVNAGAIAVSVADPAGAIGTAAINFAVKAASFVTFGSNMPAVQAYFSAFPAPFFAFKSNSTRLGYATNPNLLLVDNHFTEIGFITDGIAPFTSSISRILQAAQKRADSFADKLDRGMPVNLGEAPFYQHYGQLALKGPQCSGGAAAGPGALKGPDCEQKDGTE